MKLRFTNTIDDLLALNDFNHTDSPSLRRSLKRYQWGGALGIFGSMLIMAAMLSRLLEVPLIIGIVFASLYAAYYAWTAPKRYRKIVHTSIRKLCAEGTNKRLLCEHELEVVADGLIERTIYNESKIAWGAIEKIEATAEHTFLFVGPATAYIIPNKRLRTGNLRDFMDELQTNFVPDQPLQTSLSVPIPVPVPSRTQIQTPSQKETVTVSQGTKPWYLS